MAKNEPTQTIAERLTSPKLFLIALFMFVCLFYGSILYYHSRTPRSTSGQPVSFLDSCREICLKYGLVSTGNVAEDAKAYLAARGAKQLSQPLQELLNDESFTPVESQAHPLLGKSVPEFELLDHQRNPVSLSSYQSEGPVVLVFYNGYGCSHCVAQLIGIQRDLEYFGELRAKVIAVSDDSPEHTSEKYAEFGEFDFAVLSDPDNLIAKKYGCYEAGNDVAPDTKLHGTFVIDRAGQLIFSHRGSEPFADNRALLKILATSQPEQIIAFSPSELATE